jgi:DNA-binding CsgD family transcriptional regulator
LDGAEAVGVAEDIRAEEVLDLLSELVEHSMAVAETGGAYSVRYKMLEPVCQYAQELLERSGETEVVRSRHARLFLALAQRTYPELRGARQVEGLNRLAQDNDNLRAAMSWLLFEGDAKSAARLGHSLWPYWYFRLQVREGLAMMEAVLESESELPPILRIEANVAAGTMVYARGDMEATERYGKKLLGLSRQMGGDASAEGWGEMGLGLVEMDRGNFEASTGHLKGSLPFLYECGELAQAASVHHALGVVSMLQDDHELASSWFEEGLALARRVGDRVGIYDALYNLAQVALIRGDRGMAKSGFEEAMALSEQIGDRPMMAYCLEGLAAMAGTQGKMERLACLFGAAEGFFTTLGLPVSNWLAAKSPEQGYGREQRHQGQLYKPSRSLYQRLITHARAELGEEAFEAAWAEGRGMSFEQAVEYARSGEEAALPSVAVSGQPSASTGATRLTRREEALTALVAQGLTNRQIATELSISEHTAATHVARILKKLGLRSRAQIGSWLSEQQKPR